MNSANAIGFVALGLAMWLLPSVAPAYFPHSAVDGSSTRALWLEVMGLFQLGLGLVYLVNQYAHVARGRQSAPTETAGVPQAAAAVEAELGATLAAVSLARTNVQANSAAAEPVGSVILHGEHAALWRAFNDALRADGHVRQLAARLASMLETPEASRQPVPAAVVGEAADSENVLAFAWAEEQREPAEEQVA